MTSDKREKAIKYLTEEIRSLRMAPQINGCGPENWEEQLEIMETCLECGVEFKMKYDPNTNGAQYIIDPAKAAREIIEKFNRREGEHNNELE